jgi:hypothetical protein
MEDERFSFYTALDGVHIDGLIGSAGILRFDFPECKFYINHFEGISSAHNVSLAPNGQLALLGNFSQQIVLTDITQPNKMKIAARQSTMYFEECAYRLRANTHHLWYADSERFIGAIGDHIYRFNINDLKSPENLGPHYLENAHELRWDASNRYILIGDLGPEKYDVRQICVFDLEETEPSKRARIIKVQNNIWHNCVHPTKPVGYALTYSITADYENFIEWSPSYVREYIYEIDLPTAKITRIWSSGAEFPIHLNSDVEVTADNNLYIASGAGHCVVQIPLDTFDESHIIDCVPGLWERLRQTPKFIKNVLGALSRRPALTSTHYILQTLQATRGRITDGVYAARVSPKGKYLIAGNRGYNYLCIYDRQNLKKVFDTVLPFRRDVFNQSPYQRLGRRGHHLGIHHSEVVARE